MRKALLPLFLLVSTLGAHAAELKPMTVAYSVMSDGKVVGEATYSLSSNPDGTWTLRSQTRGTAGMARLAGLDIREESVFDWRGDSASGVRYDYRQDRAFKRTAQTIDFDRAAKHARVKDSKGNFDYPVPDGAMDRATLYLVLGHAAASGVKDITLAVAGRDHLEQQHFVAHGEETVQVPAGNYKAVTFERVDKAGKARSWYSPTSLLPLRIEKTLGDGSTITLELKQ